MQARFAPVLAGIVLLVSPGFCDWACAQVLSHRVSTRVHEAGVPSGSQVMTGRLEQRDQRYVLVDDADEVETYLISRASLDLEKYVGKRVHLMVREPLLRQDDESRVWVDRVTLAGTRESGARSLTDSSHKESSPMPPLLALAQYTEPITPEELAIPGVEMPESVSPTLGVPGVAMPVTESVSPCGPRGWIWAGAEYLLWRTDPVHMPALVTTSPNGTPRAQAGVLGLPGTSVLYGDQDVFDGNTNGARVYAGLYFDRQSAVGIQGDFLWMETQNSDFLAGSNASGTPILARPFFNLNPRNPLTLAFNPPAREDARLASYPGVIRGSVGVEASSQLQSMGLALRSLLACESFCDEQRFAYSRVDMITGYRYMQLNEDLRIFEDLSSLDQLPLVSFEVIDEFNTRNQLHAIDVGAIWQGGWQRLSLDLTLKTALGFNRQEVDILGATTIAQTGSAVAYTGGVLALPSNIGLHSRDRFAVVPELNATVGFHITDHIRLTAGYTFIFWGSVLRAGDQIDLDVNPDQIAPPISPLAGPLRPNFAFQESTYWAQGVSAGIEGRW